MWINKKFGSAGLILLTGIGYIFTILMFKRMDTVSLNTLHFFTGHLPEFCFGILLASKKELKISVWMFLLFCLIFISGNFYEWMWPYTYLSLTIIFIVCAVVPNPPTIISFSLSF